MQVVGPGPWLRVPGLATAYSGRGGGQDILPKVMPSSLTLDDVIERDPEKVSGACVFRGSRLPVMTLFDNLDFGEAVDDFMENYPGVPREYIDIVLLPENRERVAAIVEADRKEDRRAWKALVAKEGQKPEIDPGS